MSNRLRSPTAIGEINSRDPDILARVVLLAGQVRTAQKSYFAMRSSGVALDLLQQSKALERQLDIAIDAITVGGRAQQGDLLG